MTGAHPDLSTCRTCGEETSRSDGLCVDCEVERKALRTDADLRAEFSRNQLSMQCVRSQRCAWRSFINRYRGGPEALQCVLDLAEDVIHATSLERLREARFNFLAARLDALRTGLIYAGRKLA
ncbi:MAG: hypothetical protein GY711_11465 [bacterium]|nr:hypothetical protein [bacterium]